jgi:hypothetical protein
MYSDGSQMSLGSCSPFGIKSLSPYGTAQFSFKKFT